MSSANLDLVRSIYAAWERGDYGSAEWAHPEIEVVVADGPAPGRWTGLAGMRTVWREWGDVLTNLRTTADDFRELDRERVLVLVHRSGRAKVSGLELDQMQRPGADLFHVRDEQVTRFVVYWERDYALADLGLTPEAGATEA
jgi:ketosteroid isomerase-like protein